MLNALLSLLRLLLGSKSGAPAPTPQPKHAAMSEHGLAVLKYFESCKLEAYWDADGRVWTIGWGDTGPGVVKGLVITQEEADQRLKSRLEKEFVPGVLRVLRRDPSQGQLDAMVDLAYNIGLGNFSTSTLLRKFNAGDAAGAALEFKRWRFSKGKEMLGLFRRRKADEALFNGDTGQAAIKIGANFDKIDLT